MHACPGCTVRQTIATSRILAPGKTPQCAVFGNFDQYIPPGSNHVDQAAPMAWSMQGDTLGPKGHVKVTDGRWVLTDVPPPCSGTPLGLIPRGRFRTGLPGALRAFRETILCDQCNAAGHATAERWRQFRDRPGD